MTPDTQAPRSGGALVARRMKYAARNAEWIWNATKFLAAFLGVSAPVTFGLELTGDRELAAFRWLVVAATGFLVGGVLQGLTLTIARSQSSRAAEIERNAGRRRAGQISATVSVLGQLACAAVLLLGQSAALWVALGPEQRPPNPDAMLLETLSGYVGMTKTARDARAVCRRFASDDRATNAFRAACQEFRSRADPEASTIEPYISRLEKTAR